MFTGIIEETGYIRKIRRHSSSASLTVTCKKILDDIHIGDSIAVNGICLTVIDFQDHCFTVDVMPETIRRTSLSGLNSGDPVNLERAMSCDKRFGGHMVSGHIDGVGTMIQCEENEIAVIFRIRCAPELLEGIIEKGSVCLDGISLTVVDVDATSFSVSIIPHTISVTNLQNKTIGDPINIETDMIGKYVRKYLDNYEPPKTEKKDISMDFLAEKGFL